MKLEEGRRRQRKAKPEGRVPPDPLITVFNHPEQRKESDPPQKR